jgi:hypothetical protein
VTIFYLKQDHRSQPTIFFPKQNPIFIMLLKSLYNFDMEYQQTTMYQLKIRIDDITPPIWRLISIPETFSLNKLHHIIQIAFGWMNSHLYCFWQEDVTITDPLLWGGGTVRWDKKVKIKDVLKVIGDVLPYEYDLGDSWQHSIILEKIEVCGLNARRCLDGGRNAPPEDCGGVHGYQELIQHRYTPEKDGYIELLEWLGEEYDPEHFDLSGVNRGLKGLAKYIKEFEKENGLR